jgi:uncharacterized protein (TIGR02145 family)
MKNRILSGLFLLVPFLLYSQGEFNHWCFGTYKHICFNSGFPVNYPNTSMYVNGGSISVSDSAGTLLFCSAGTKIYNRNNSVMPNGSGLGGSTVSWSSSTLSVKSIANDSIYYIFTGGYQPNSPPIETHAEFSVLDMRLNGTLGDIVTGQKNIHLQGGFRAYGPVGGTRQPNNRDAWVVFRLSNADSNYFVSYPVNKAGVGTIPVYSPSLVDLPTPVTATTQIIPQTIRLSRDGKILICIYDFSNSNINDTIEVCDFNPATGQVSPRFKYRIRYKGQVICYHGVEFSIDSKLFYLSGYPDANHNYAFQFSAEALDTTQLALSQTMIGNAALQHPVPQMATDWKIYFSTDITDTMAIIHNPSIQGTGCNYQRQGFYMGDGYHADGLPQYVERYKAYIHYTGNCLNTLVNFSGDIWPPADTISWNFGDPASGSSNGSILPSPPHIYSDTGSYVVTLYVRHNDTRTDTSHITIHIMLSPDVNLGPDRTLCAGDTVTFHASHCSACTFIWKNENTNTVVGTDTILRTPVPGIYTIREIQPNGCEGRDTVQLFTTPVPSVTNSPLSKTICSGDSTKITLLSGVPGTNFHWTAALTSGNVTGFQADSGTVINQVLNLLSGSGGTVTYTITPNVGSCFGTSVPFIVDVYPKDTVKVTVAVSANPVCTGTPVTFTATGTNPGASPVYAWFVNGMPSGVNSTVFTYTPINGDSVTCKLVSSITNCITNNPAFSNKIGMSVQPYMPVSIFVTANPAGPVCTGTSVTFTANPVNPGPSPVYTWQVNGVSMGAAGAVFVYTPSNGDVITCTLLSSLLCTTGNPATSLPVTMAVSIPLTAGVSISGTPNPFCPGSPVTFTAIPTNGGTAPVYEWRVNGTVHGGNSSVFSYNAAVNDSVWCILTSNYACISGNPAVSNRIIMNNSLAPFVTFIPCFDTITTVNARPIRLKGGIPNGGVYSGPGVVSNIFYPALAGSGLKQIAYTYTNAASCSDVRYVMCDVRLPSAFSCGNILLDVRDNKSYRTVQIGGQCWMAENLDHGTLIPSNMNQRDNCIAEKYCYNDLTANCGLQTFYQWDELMLYNDSPGNQGFCPPGWHVPTDAEWTTLFMNWGNSAFAGSALIYSGFSGFNAQLSGAGHYNTQWDYSNFAAFFWTSTSHGNSRAWSHGMNDVPDDHSVCLYPSARTNAFSVRCLKD